MAKESMTPNAILRKSLKVLQDAHKEAKRRGDIEALLNIGITYAELAGKIPGNPKKKQHLGFHHERVYDDRTDES